ncbi:MAG: hypothetical protein ACXW3O_09095 [Brevundimonas sp.]
MDWSLPLLAALAALALPQQPAGQAQAPAAQLADVEITRRQTVDMARSFVGRVAAPARGRGLGRWRRICPAVANLDRAVAQVIVDRIALTAADLGIEVQGPGCEADIIIVFTTAAPALTRAMVEAEPLVFRQGGGCIDRGTAALGRFIASERPVRWWTLSVPVDSETGRRAVRARGDPGGAAVSSRVAALFGCNPADCVAAAAPAIAVNSASRLNTQIVDHIYKSIIIVDMDAVAGLNTTQLGDYLAMVSLTQVDPEAETGAFDTVLNLFEAPDGVTGLTDWDRSYMEALYGSPSLRLSVGAQAGAVAAIMNRDARTAPAE